MVSCRSILGPRLSKTRSSKSKFLRSFVKMKITEAIEIIRKACDSRDPKLESLVTSSLLLLTAKQLQLELERILLPSRCLRKLDLFKDVTAIKIQNEPIVGIKLGKPLL